MQVEERGGNGRETGAPRALRKAVRHLDERLLRDIGLSAEEGERHLPRPFWWLWPPD
jgi:uncharacterized protein YjiS (DUF1127 family)